MFLTTARQVGLNAVDLVVHRNQNECVGIHYDCEPATMAIQSVDPLAIARRPRLGAGLVAVGLSVMAAMSWWQSAPVAAAAALVALGATYITIDDFGRHPAFLTIAASHLLVYGTLISLFAGSLVHKVGTRQSGWQWNQLMDLAAGATAVILAAQCMSKALALRLRGEDPTGG